MGPAATHICKDGQICGGFKSGIDGSGFGVQYIWDDNSTEEIWGFLVIDAKNIFIDIDQIRILWTVSHLWMYGARFVFNSYCHHYLLVLRNRDGTSNIIHSREGVTHGNPLAMLDYGVEVLPLIKFPKWVYTEVTQPWYTDDARALVRLYNLEIYLIF